MKELLELLKELGKGGIVQFQKNEHDITIKVCTIVNGENSGAEMKCLAYDYPIPEKILELCLDLLKTELKGFKNASSKPTCG